jgi:hypothetical protein
MQLTLSQRGIIKAIVSFQIKKLYCLFVNIETRSQPPAGKLVTLRLPGLVILKQIQLVILQPVGLVRLQPVGLVRLQPAGLVSFHPEGLFSLQQARTTVPASRTNIPPSWLDSSPLAMQ